MSACSKKSDKCPDPCGHWSEVKLAAASGFKDGAKQACRENERKLFISPESKIGAIIDGAGEASVEALKGVVKHLAGGAEKEGGHAVGANIKVSVGAKLKSGQDTTDDGTVISETREDIGLHVRVPSEAVGSNTLGVVSVGATIGKSKRVISKAFEQDSLSIREQRKDDFTGVRASIDICGVECADVSTGTNMVNVQGHLFDESAFVSHEKSYLENWEQAKLLGITCHSKLTDARISQTDQVLGGVATNEEIIEFTSQGSSKATGSYTKETEKSLLGIGYTQTQKGTSQYDSESKNITNEEVAESSFALNQQTKQALHVGTITAVANLTAANAQSFHTHAGVSDIGKCVGSQIATSVGATMAGNAVHVLTGCEAARQHGGSALRVAAALNEGGGAAAGEAIVREIRCSGANKVTSVLSGGAIPSMERDNDGNIQRLKLTGALTNEVAIGKHTKESTGKLSNGDVEHIKREDVGLQFRKSTDSLSVTSVSGNVGVSKVGKTIIGSGSLGSTRTVKTDDELKGVRASLDIIGIEVLDVSTGRCHTLQTTENKLGVEALNGRYCSSVKTSGAKVLGLQISTARTTTHEVGATMFGFGAAVGVEETHKWFCKDEVGTMKFQLLFLDGDFRTDGLPALKLTQEGQALMGQGFSIFATEFSQVLFNGGSFSDALTAGKDGLYAKIGLVAKDIFYTQVSSALCQLAIDGVDRAVKFASNDLENVMKMVTPFFGCAISALARPLVEAMLKGFSREQFTKDYLRQLTLNALTTILSVAGFEKVKIIVESVFHKVYDNWHGAETNFVQLFFDLFPVLFQLLGELGLKGVPGGNFIVFGIKYVLVPVLAQLLQTEMVQKFKKVVTEKLSLEISHMKQTIADLDFGEVFIIAGAALEAGIWGYMGYTTSVAAFTPLGVVAIGLGAAVVAGSGAFALRSHVKETKKKEKFNRLKAIIDSDRKMKMLVDAGQKDVDEHAKEKNSSRTGLAHIISTLL